MQKLKPCPFCGGNAVVDDSCTDITIKCGGECGAEPRYLTFGLDQTKRDAIKAWNTRTPKREVVDVAALRDVAQHIQVEASMYIPGSKVGKPYSAGTQGRLLQWAADIEKAIK